MRIFKALFTFMLLHIVLDMHAQGNNAAKGRVFWLGFMQNYEGASDLRVFISSEVATTGTVSAPLLGWSVDITVPANTIASVSIPVQYMHTGSEFIDNKAILISMQDSCTASALNFQNATADASIILPEQMLGREYRVQAYKGLQNYTYNSEALIVCTTDSAEVEITPSCTTYEGQPANVPFTVLLHLGESYQVQALTSADDLTGTVVRALNSPSCHPIAVFGGSVCPNIPVGCFACDHVFEQNSPVSAWGDRYYVTPFSDQTFYTLQLLAGDEATTILRDDVPLVMLGPGDRYEINSETDAHCLSGTTPFSVAMFMQGNSCSGGNSDPSMLILNRDREVATNVTFATVISAQITQQWVNIVTTPDNTGTVYLDGELVDSLLFQSFPACTDRVWTSLPLTQTAHTITASAGFSAYVYGTGPNFETYAYALGTTGSLSSDTVICHTGDSITLQAPGWMNDPYWYVEGAPQDTLTTELTYSFDPDSSVVIVVSQIGGTSCIQEQRYLIGMSDTIQVLLSADPAVVCPGDPTLLVASIVPPMPDGQVTWSPASLVVPPWGYATQGYPMNDTWFVAHATANLGCSSATDSILVSALPAVTVPSITQNGNTLATGVYSSYQWYFDGSPIPGANAQTYEMTASGFYMVTVTDANGCAVSSGSYPAIYVGIAENFPYGVVVSSNEGIIRVRASGNIDMIEVFDLLGQRIGDARGPAKAFDHGVSSDGVYFVRLHAGGASMTERVVVFR